MHRYLTALVVAALGAVSPVVCQQAAVTPSMPTDDVLGVGWIDGQLRAASRAFHARFEPGAFEITPAFGRRAPRTYPLRVALESVRRGDAIVLRAAHERTPQPRLVGESVYYDHSAAIVERYDVRAEGVKQSVVFAERPQGAGDLVVRYAVDTDLVCGNHERAETLWFGAEAFGGVAIDAVVGIDANGRRQRGHMAFDGEALELVLPADFVASASYPLELDPLFGPQLNTGVSFDDHFPDIAYDDASGVYCIAFEFPASATSSATYVMRQDAASGAMLGGIFLGNPGSHPGVASVRQSGQFLVVWQDDSSGTANIRCRAVRASDGALSNTVTIAGTAAEERAPDVGGDAFANADLDAVVVWEETGAGIRCVQVTVPPSGDPVVVGAPTVLDASPDAADPAISKSGGFDAATGGRYVVAWETVITGTELVAYLGIDQDCNVLTPVSFAASGFPIDNVDVDGDGTEFLIVFESLESAVATTSDIWCQPATFCAAGTSLCGGVAEVLVDVLNDDQRQPAVAFLGSMYAVAWSDSNPGSATDYRIGVSNVVRNSCALCNQQVLTGNATAFFSSYPALCAKRSNGVESDEGLLTWEQLENSSGNSLLRSHRYRPFNGGTVTPLAGFGGCGTGGNAGADGAFAVGNPDFKLTLRNADPLSPAAFLMFDTAMAAPTVCGSCTVLTAQIISPLFAVANGEADVPLPLPCDTGLLGFTMDVQWAVVTPPSTTPPCSLFPFVSASDAVRMVLDN